MKRSMDSMGGGMLQMNVSKKEGSTANSSFVTNNPLSENETGLGVEINLGEGGEGIYTGNASFSAAETGFGERVPASKEESGEQPVEQKEDPKKIISGDDSFISVGSASAFEGTERTYESEDSDEDHDDRLIDCFY
ncbi:hypothetical protein ACX0G9_03260 [Flavitalea flava]